MSSLWLVLLFSWVGPGAGVTVNKSRIIWGKAPPHSFVSCLNPDGFYLHPRGSAQVRADGTFQLVTSHQCQDVIIKSFGAAPQKWNLHGSAGLIHQVDFRLWGNMQKHTSQKEMFSNEQKSPFLLANLEQAGKFIFVLAIGFILIFVICRLVSSIDHEFSSTDKLTDDMISRAMDHGCEDTMSAHSMSGSEAESSSEAGSEGGLSAATFVVQPCTHIHNAGMYNLRRKCAECAKTQLVREKRPASLSVSQSAGALPTFLLGKDGQQGTSAA